MDNNPVRQAYDYGSGSGMDSFLSRSIDEVSWQNTLGASYNTLSNLPIGAYQTSATPTNFDSSQVSGSIGGAIAMGGGSSSGSGGGSAGNIIIDGVGGKISILDSGGNEVGRIGNLSD